MSDLYQYRVLETDDDGDPMDHGVVRADDFDEACALVEAHLTDLQLSDEWTCSGVEVRFYQLRDRSTPGVLKSTDDYQQVVLMPRGEDDAGA